MTRIAEKNHSAKVPARKMFYFLIAGNVAFYAKNVPVPEGETPDVGTLPLNAVMSNESGQLPTSALADAQVALSQALVDKIGHAEPVEIVDVQLINICKLGHMLPSEFHDLQKQAAPAPEPSMEEHAPAKVV